MILFLSDMHLGAGAPDQARELERELIDFLHAHEEEIDHLYLMGDVFDAYIEYRTLVPKGFARLQGLLAAWTDAGRPVTYLVGNHDPWHLDYFEDELGVRVEYEALTVSHYGQQIYLAHGDGLKGPTDRRVRALLRHPLATWGYRTFLPGDLGFRLARWWSDTFGRDHIRPSLVEALEAHARGKLRETSASYAVLAHTHHPIRRAWPEGTYVNTGSWREHRSYAVLTEAGLKLLEWNHAL